MASVDLSRRVAKVAGYPPLSEMSAEQRREFHESLLDADSFEDVPGKWRAAIIKAERNRPKLRLVSEAYYSPTEVRFPSPTASRASAHSGHERKPHHLPSTVKRAGIGANRRLSPRFQALVPETERRSAPSRRSPQTKRTAEQRLSEMELAGLEPATSWVRSRRSPN
jgi:hypothetical protein